VTAAVEGDGDDLELVLASHPSSLAETRDAVADFARQCGSQVEAVKLAVTEAVGNAMLHAFRGRDPGTIAIRARSARDGLLVTVADDGIGMAPNPDSPGLGIGISLIGKLADEVHLSSSAHGTIISMSFAAAELPRRDEPTAQASRMDA
jgi:anti-sigma regulatory factor (Ser/Thr protein kinase)